MSRGYVTFEVDGAVFAVRVDEVREVVRVAANDLLATGERTVAGRELGLLDVRRRTVPVLDLRSRKGGEAEAILPRRRPLAGLVVDRVTAVVASTDLVAQEADDRALPSYAVGVLRPSTGGAPVLLVALPEVAAADAPPIPEPALGTALLLAT